MRENADNARIWPHRRPAIATIAVRKALTREFSALRAILMKRLLFLLVAAVTALPCGRAAQAQPRAQYEKLVATHAKANLVPEALVHRVIVRESRYQADLVGRGGTIGLMQIKLPTARSLGYSGDAEGLRDPDTNLHYGVRYLAGAYRAANGDHDRAVQLYASGYYQTARQQRLEQERARQAAELLASAAPKQATEPEPAARPEEVARPREAANEVTKPDEVAKPESDAKAAEIAKPKLAAATPKASVTPQAAVTKPKKQPRKKLAETREPIPRPPANIPAGANPAMPR